MTTTTTTTATAAATIDWAEYLKEIVSKPGIISEAYTAFHNYSFCNQLHAWAQCLARGIQPGPIATFNGWKDKNRFVKKGEKAIELCMPVLTDEKDANGIKTGEKRRFFMMRKNWFVVSQTQGEDFTPTAPNLAWDKAKALKELDITETAFSSFNGNCQGFARERAIAINPVAALPLKTTFHEMAHIVLGHTAEHETMSDDERTPRNIREVEAESTAYILCNVLGLPGADEARGYVQEWLDQEQISGKSAQRVLTAADRILRAGLPSASHDHDKAP